MFGVRSFASSLVRRVVAREVEAEVARQRAAAPEPAPTPAPAATAPTPPVDAAVTGELTALKERADKLEKKLSMAMGALQAASAQIVDLRKEVETAANLGNQAMQKAVSALATAEAASEGVTALEAAVTAPPGSDA